MRRLAFLFVLLVSATQVIAAEVVLYDGGVGSLPNAQSWLALGTGTFQAPTHTGQGVNINTTADSDAQFGYFSEDPFFGTSQHPLLPTLSRHDGFDISLRGAHRGWHADA